MEENEESDDILFDFRKFEELLKDICISDPKKHGCEELPIYLEWGTFNKNTLFFMELGLSRSVSILLNERIGADLDTSTDCLVWLRQNEKSLEGTMPDIFYKEIERLLENKHKGNQTS
jgi:hypothetical protein